MSDPISRRIHDPRVDARLREVVAMALCWAEFGPCVGERRADDPASYWATMRPEARKRYYIDANTLALVMMGVEAVKIVPLEPTPEMVGAARVVRPALRADNHVRDVWRAMLHEAPRLPAREP